MDFSILKHRVLNIIQSQYQQDIVVKIHVIRDTSSSDVCYAMMSYNFQERVIPILSIFNFSS